MDLSAQNLIYRNPNGSHHWPTPLLLSLLPPPPLALM